MSRKLFLPLVNMALVLIIIILLHKVLYIVSPLKNVLKVLLTPIVISLFLYYTLRPLVKFFEYKKVNKTIVTLLTILSFMVILSVSLIFAALVVKDDFIDSFSYDKNSTLSYFNNLDNKLGGILSQTGFTERLLEPARNIMLKFSSSIVNILSQISSISTQVILVPFILFYFLKEDKKIAKSGMAIVPNRYRNHIEDMFIQIDRVLSTYISGQLMVAIVIGILMYISYLIIGMPNALLMAFFSMVTSIIPFIGPFLGIIPALLIGLTINVAMLLKIIIAAIVVQQIEGNLITPNIIGNKLNVHPLAVIFIVIISVMLFGILGAFVGIPLFVILSIIIKNIYKIYITKKLKVDK